MGIIFKVAPTVIEFDEMNDPNYLSNVELFFLFRQKAVFTIVIWLSISKCTLLNCNGPITS